jgi:uncharacterized protein (TIGR03118 family)
MHVCHFPIRARLLMAMVLAIALLLPMSLQSATAAGPRAGFYKVTPLVSDLPGVAAFTDPHLVNPWGISYAPSGPFWVSDNGTGLSTVYESNGMPTPTVVTIPTASGMGTGSPTGTVYNNTSGFVIKQGNQSGPSLFLFDTLDGTISGWNPTVNPTSAVIAVNNSSSASYTGLAIATNAAGTFLYAANSLPSSANPHGSIDVFDQNFNLTHLQGSFTDPNLPAGYTPYGIQAIKNFIVVTYTPFPPKPGLGIGVVDVYDTEGNLMRRFATGGQLDLPWGIALAPASFGQFSNDVLIGNVGNGRINAFNPRTGAFLGPLTNQSGKPIAFPGLWGLIFGNGGQGGSPNILYFSAGIELYRHGLFGSIAAVS